MVASVVLALFILTKTTASLQWYVGRRSNVASVVSVSPCDIDVDRQNGEANLRPIVGVLAEELSHPVAPQFGNATSYLDAAYVKFLESAGARVAPVFVGRSDDYYVDIVARTNGILLPGGGVSLTRSRFAAAAARLLAAAIAARDPYPVWGTCLGFELLVVLTANATTPSDNLLRRCQSENEPSKLVPTDSFHSGDSLLARDMPDDVYRIITTQKTLANYHRKCLTMDSVAAYGLDSFWHILAMDKDQNGVEFVSLIEARDFPIWGSQFHPEKVMFEWSMRVNSATPHGAAAVRAMTYLAQFFVAQTRANGNKFHSRKEEEAALIYNYKPEYVGKESIDYKMQQVYLFYDDLQ